MNACSARITEAALGLLVISALLAGVSVSAAEEHGTAESHTDPRPSIALIIDDLGNRREQGRQAVSLPGPVACAFLPYGHFTRQLAQQAHTSRKEVMLHLPMQAADHPPLDKGELTLDMTQHQFMEALQQDLAVIPHVSGVNNHRGSLLTRHPGHMAWLMQGIGQHGALFFVDSRTTPATVASQLAGEYDIPSIERKVFLDNVRSADAVVEQFRRLLNIARREGTALGIGHPHPETLAVLTQELGLLDDYNIQLVPVKRLIEINKERKSSWQASLFR
ncbi:MAG: divergent polysaccharide deacetylase family protein [Pseudomonadota bacterium]|nr:divergent polysaccharide deacetylase family protein [Pseudomonadota bacterium]